MFWEDLGDNLPTTSVNKNRKIDGLRVKDHALVALERVDRLSLTEILRDRSERIKAMAATAPKNIKPCEMNTQANYIDDFS